MYAAAPRFLRWVFLAPAAFCLLGGAAGRSAPAEPPATAAAAAAPAKSPAPGPLILEEKPEALVPKTPRTEAERDRLEALALFSAARLRENQQDYSGALRLYQRASRYDPDSGAIVRAIVVLAARLERHAEAVRYALKLVELEDADPLLLKRLAVYLTETGDWPRALNLYEKALAVRKGAKPVSDDVMLWMELGRLYHLTEKPDKAADSFARVLEAIEHPEQYGLDEAAKKTLLSEPGPTYNLMGESFLLAGRFEKAAQAFEKAHQAAPDKGLLSYQLARVEARAGKPEKALEKLQASFDAHLATEGMAPYRLLAEVLKTLHRENELLGRLEALRAADPDNVPLGHFLAEKYLEAQQAEKAEPLYRAMAGKSPTVAAYRNLVGIYRKGKRYDALLAVLAEAVSHLAGLESLAEKDRPLGEDAELVRKLVDTARQQLKADPKGLGYDARLAVALLALEAKQFDTAAEFFDLAVQAKPDQASKVFLAWGLGVALQDDHARAARVFQRGIQQKALPEKDPTFHFYLAGALEMAGRTDEALAAARKAVELASAQQADKASKESQAKNEFPRCLARVAWVLYHSKRYDEAAKAYRELIEKHAADYSSERARAVVREARLALSNVAVVKNDNARAVEWLEQVLDEFPEDPSALNDLGYIWAEQGKHLERAHRMIRKAVEKEPDNAAYRDSLGWVLFQKGRIQEALPELEKAAALEPDPTVLDHLGDAHRAIGQPQKAKDAWRRAAEALQKAGETEKAKKVQEKLKGIPQPPAPSPQSPYC